MSSKTSGAIANSLTNAVLKYMAFMFQNVEKNRKYLKTVDGWMNFTIGLTTEDGLVAQAISFKEGKVTVIPSVENADTVLILQDTKVLAQLASLPPNEVLNLMLKNKMASSGNMSYLEYFNFLISVLMKKKQIKQMHAQIKEREEFGKSMSDAPAKAQSKPRKEFIKAEHVDPGVKYLTDDPYLSKYAIEDFPRLMRLLKHHREDIPEICIERPSILTDYFRENGFETQKDGKAWVPEVRQGKALRYYFEHRKPLIHEDCIIPGSTTTKRKGVVLYPDGVGLIFWGELLTVSERMLNPYTPLTEEEIYKLNNDIFPFYTKRNFREYVRDKYNEPLSQKLDERWAAIFMWKTVALSHTILDYPKLLKMGIRGMIEELTGKRDSFDVPDSKKDYINSMIDCLEGVISYAHHLSDEATKMAQSEKDSARKAELLAMSEWVRKCPENPAESVDEAMTAIWVMWVCLQNENTNAGLSFGRMDQWLQPYFESDMSKFITSEEKEKYIYHVLELLGCFYILAQDNVVLFPDIGNYLFGGSLSAQALTLGGITPDGEDAVNDMTYLFLKATEIMSVRDPNINARYNSDKNSEDYLRRLCEVNVNTTSTPAIHNDKIVMASLKDHNYEPGELNDWAATGCVEPTIAGRHLGHTNCMMFNMVAALEMAMHNGYHPLMRWDLGPHTGEAEDFDTFDKFFEAFEKQLTCLVDLSCEYNNMLGEAHSVIRPTPLLSSMLEGCSDKGIDCTKGGTKYNSSGTACIGLADVVDSLMAIKTLCFDRKEYTLREIIEATNVDFEGYDVMRSRILNEVPRFGSGNSEAVAMANRITAFMKKSFWEHINFRGGHYTTGFWSMSNHVAFGTLTGALPSGRKAYLPFTPGLTPEANASASLLDNIKDVAGLDPINMNNNIAFNVKVNPAGDDTHSQTVEHLKNYAKSYFTLGGMQIQFNVVSSDTLRAAMANPDEYKDLMVRISGYNAYFTGLDKELQLELIRRADYH